MDYRLPQRDIAFLLTEVLDLDQTLALPGYDHCDTDTALAVVEGVAGFVRDALLPCNVDGDRIGARLDQGQVRAAPGFAEAYAQFCDDGWNGLAMDSDIGGQQLPFVLHAALREGMAAANLSFALIHELNFGVVEALLAHGSDEQKRVYCPALAEGRWAGTMNLTEPHCGTDLGLIRTRAQRRDDGSFAISGAKIFITWGDHDMSENVAHLILARIDGAPAGPRGLSLFLAPKFMLDDQGRTTERRNAIRISGLEDKMGLHGSPTCAIDFDGATAWLVGAEGQGLAGMFVMMNAARLSVGLQGLGIAEAAHQAATTYAHTRLQGRAEGGALMPEAMADPLVAHADVRRRLLMAQGELDAARALAYLAAGLLDRAHRADQPADRQAADTRLSLLTPVLKSYLSDLGSRFAHEAVQMHGGHGFVRDFGVEQLVRDVRICAIYEGTNAVQARDLVLRKVRADQGAEIESCVSDLRALADTLSLELADVAAALGQAADRLTLATDWLLAASREDALAGACDYLDLLALCLCAGMAGRIAAAAAAGDGPQSPDYYADRLDAARAYLQRALPRSLSLQETMRAGAPALSDPLFRAERCL